MSKTSSPRIVNLNSAPPEVLTQLPGVGPALAGRIVAARPFGNVRDLILVPGVGPRLYATLLPYLTLDDSAATVEAPTPSAEPAVGPAADHAELPAAPPEPAAATAIWEPATPSAPLTETPPPAPISPPSSAQAPPASHDGPPADEPRPRHTSRRRTTAAARPEPAAPEGPAAANPDEPSAEPLPPAGPPTPPARPAPYYSAQGPLAPAAPIAEPSSRARNRLLEVPVRTRWRVMLLLFYGMIALALVGLAALFYAAFSPTLALSPAATATAAPTSTLPEPAITAVVVAPPSATLAPSATPPSPSDTPLAVAVVSSATPEVTATLSAPSPTATLAPASATPSRTPTPAPTDTATPRPSPTLSPTASASPTNTPPPTATATPTVTAAPTVAPTAPAGAGALRFLETFDPPEFYWGVGNTNFGRSALADDELQVQAGRAALLYVFGSMEPAADFYYQATTRAGACGEGDSYGLQVRAEDDFNYYLFGVTCEGRIRIQVLKDGQYTVLVNSEQPDRNVRTGPDAVNVLAVRAQGRQFQFYANGRLLTTVTDESLTAGKFGVYARSFRSASFDVRFDDVAGWATAE